jgi:hypothetical protein
MKEWWGGKEKKKHTRKREWNNTQESWRSGVCVCVCWWWCKKKAPPRSYRSWPQSRTHITHRSKARETCGFLCCCFCPGDPGHQVPSRRFSKQSGKKGDTHTLWYWLVMHVRTKGISLWNKNNKKKTSIASSSSCLVALYSSFLFLFVSNYFSLSSLYLLSSTHTHTHTHGILCPL